MVESGNAVALMGNHEYNALCFHYQETEGGHLRRHLIKNIIQHYETLKQFQNMQREYEEYLDWFKTLPLFYENESLRAVHACWDAEHIRLLRDTLENDRLTEDLIYESVKKGTEFNNALEDNLKGKEIRMPIGLTFTDKDGAIRHDIRVKWWENPSRITYKDYSVEPIDNLPLSPVQSHHKDYYSENDKPVFFGHYWLKGNPSLYRNNICCLDYSVANGGLLAAYRFDGEKVLDESKFVYV